MIKMTTPSFTKVHTRFKLNSIHYTYDDLQEVAYSFIKEGTSYEQVIGNFLIDWLDYKDTIKVETSGSTGVPKTIEIKKQAMVNSAIATGDFFNLEPGDKALHCLPTKFIAGKMMLIRAIFLGLEIDLVEPTSSPHFDTSKDYDFCAMTPMQLQNSYSQMSNIKTLIVGGAKVFNQLTENIQKYPTDIYETFGMTESITHIALKKLNNFQGENPNEARFKLLPNISISQDDRECLVIDAPELTDEKIITNDIIKIYSDDEFEWLGRYDNVINSGGVKVYPEEVEKKLQSKIMERFIVASEKDELLGEKVILILENDENELTKAIFNGLDKFEKPKEVYTVYRFSETESGKILRSETIKKALSV